MSKIKILFERAYKASIQFRREKQRLDKEIEKVYGYHYSDKDIDELIDTLDYGTGTLTFEEFNKIMLENKSVKP